MWVETQMKQNFLMVRRRHPPCEDVSWNSCSSILGAYDVLSSSLWGCELKHNEEGTKIAGMRHPPCEDVSWNLKWSDRRSRFQCHPPCEDVSWNCVNLRFMSITSVILLVRMWVETERDLHSDEIPLSSSLWGCELKRYAHWWYRLRSGVILLVRMWVETWLRRATWRS